MPKHKTKVPLTLQGAAVPKQALRSDVSLSLKVMPRDSAAAGRGLSALVHPSSIQQLLQGDGDDPSTAATTATNINSSNTDPAAAPDAAAAAEAEAADTVSSCFLQLSSGSDCVLHTRPCDSIPPGCIQVDEVQQANLRLCAGEAYSFSVFVPGGMTSTAAAAAGNDGDDDLDSSSSDGDSVTDVDMHPADTPTAAAAAAAAGEGSEAAAAATAADVSKQKAEAGEEEGGAVHQAVNPFELTDVEVEVRLLPGTSSSSSSSPVQVNAVALSQAFSRQCFGRVLAANEYVVVDLPGCPPLLLRVVCVNSLTEEEQQEVLGYHCFRGLLTPDTEVYLTTAAQQQQQQQQQQSSAAADTAQQLGSLTLQEAAAAGVAPGIHPQQQNGANGAVNGTCHDPQQQQQQQQQQPPVQSRLAAAGSSVVLLNARQRPPAAAPTNVVHVTTSDGEWFPVKKKLLRPCIALTKVVRDSGGSAPHVSLSIDCLTFDRVLIFLEAYALKRRPPRFAVHLLADLQEAGAVLGLRPLQEYCRKLLGRKQAALQMYSYADVQRANAADKVWLILDGMVLDVGRWLPEHPGGASIIPKQSLDCDCARFFEMYHASKESFLYIEEFYIGELLPSDRPAVPLGGRQPPSTDFLQQLREFTTWRHKMQQQALARGQQAAAFKSF